MATNAKAGVRWVNHLKGESMELILGGYQVQRMNNMATSLPVSPYLVSIALGHASLIEKGKKAPDVYERCSWTEDPNDSDAPPAKKSYHHNTGPRVVPLPSPHTYTQSTH